MYNPPCTAMFGYKTQYTMTGLLKQYQAPATHGDHCAVCKHIPGVHLLLLAIMWEQFAIVKFLLENKADINCADATGKTAMMYAVSTVSSISYFCVLCLLLCS